MKREPDFDIKIEGIATSIIIFMFIPLASMSMFSYDKGLEEQSLWLIILSVFCVIIGVWSYLGNNKIIPFGTGSILYIIVLILLIQSFEDSISKANPDDAGGLIFYLFAGWSVIVLATIISVIKRLDRRVPKNFEEMLTVLFHKQAEIENRPEEYSSMDLDTDIHEAVELNLEDLKKTKERLNQLLEKEDEKASKKN